MSRSLSTTRVEELGALLEDDARAFSSFALGPGDYSDLHRVIDELLSLRTELSDLRGKYAQAVLAEKQNAETIRQQQTEIRNLESRLYLATRGDAGVPA